MSHNLPSWQEYIQNYSIIARDDLKTSIQPEYYKKSQVKKTIAYLGNLKGKRVLDIGSSTGMLLQQIHSCRMKVGLDIAIEYLVVTRDKFLGVQAVAEELPFKNKSFDVVCLTDVLEHVLYPQRVLESARDALVEGGILLVRVPFKDDLTVYEPGKCKYAFVHLRSFDQKVLQKMLQNVGLRPERFHYDGFTLGAMRYRSRNTLCRIIAFFIMSIRFGIKVDKIISGLPNWLGNILCPPGEITVIARKLTTRLDNQG